MIRQKSLPKSFLLLIVISIMVACDTKNELTADIVIYENDFEDNDLTDITGGVTRSVHGSQVIGNYNNDGFTLHLNDLPRHEYIYISFRLFLHDSWDGNSNGLEPDQPDKWMMKVNSGITPTSTDSYQGFETTFSNGPCDGVLCLMQSYPSSFPHSNRPRTGARRDRVGVCRQISRGSSEYVIERTFRHEDATIIFSFYDELYQPNVADQKCDESWSMDDIIIRAITIN